MTPHEKVRCQASPNADVMDSQPVRRTEYGEPPGFEASGKQGAASVTLSPARRAISAALRCTMPRSRTAKLPLPCLHPNAGNLRGCGPSLPRAAGLARRSGRALAPGRWPVSLWGSPIACAVVAARSWPSASLDALNTSRSGLLLPSLAFNDPPAAPEARTSMAYHLSYGRCVLRSRADETWPVFP
jgi:hypothetical protein